MKNNVTITVAPQTEAVQSALSDWSTENIGDKDDFYEFLTAPSAERTEFIRKYAEQMEIRLVGNIVMEIF